MGSLVHWETIAGPLICSSLHGIKGELDTRLRMGLSTRLEIPGEASIDLTSSFCRRVNGSPRTKTSTLRCIWARTRREKSCEPQCLPMEGECPSDPSVFMSCWLVRRLQACSEPTPAPGREAILIRLRSMRIMSLHKSQLGCLV